MIPAMKSLPSRTSADARATWPCAIAAQAREPRAIHRLHPAITTHPPDSPPASQPTGKAPGVLPAMGAPDQRNRFASGRSFSLDSLRPGVTADEPPLGQDVSLDRLEHLRSRR